LGGSYGRKPLGRGAIGGAIPAGSLIWGGGSSGSDFGKCGETEGNVGPDFPGACEACIHHRSGSDLEAASENAQVTAEEDISMMDVAVEAALPILREVALQARTQSGKGSIQMAPAKYQLHHSKTEYN
jgi:hypothetical protein